MKDLNLIPKNFILQKKNKVKKTYLSILIILTGLVFVVAYTVPTIYENKLKTEKQEIQQKVTESNSFVEVDNEFNSLKQAVFNRENEGKLLSLRKMDSTGIIGAIEGALPEKIFIQKIDASGESDSTVKITLIGASENEEVIASFIRNLMDDGYFNKVDLSRIVNNPDKSGNIFEMTLTGISTSNLLKYTDWNSGYSICYPKDWLKGKVTGNKVTFTAKSSLTSAKPASLEIANEDSSSNLKGFVSNRYKKLENELKEFKSVYSIETQCSKQSAYKTMYYASEDGIMYKFLELCTIKDKKIFIITYKSEVNSFDNKQRTIDRILKSFKFE